MTKYDIINTLSDEHQIEKIVYRLIGSSKNRFDTPDDLVQDIYLILLEKDEDFIKKLYERDELGFWILRVARNQIFSTNSRYFYTYIRFRQRSDDLDKAAHIIGED